MNSIRVLLVDDHPLFRTGLAALLAKEGGFEIVGEAQDGIEALAKAKELKPELVLMDISMPRCDGLEATRRIRKALPWIKIVMLTILETEKKLFEAIKAGADGYILKNVKPEALFATLRGIAAGEAAISQVTANKIIGEFAEPPQEGRDNREDLTDREREVLQFLTQGLTNKEIGQKLNVAENTVKNHLKNILGKLQVENRVQAATLALKEGLTGGETPNS
ncbi:MAG TPA: response regulator transcription factor [Verrucomicrobiae bacterium]|jgi:DNA-binding NarL/FixJ family response regulator|nr:response regulator transcription factor [Verrucomicrobiae bacterium]